MSDPRHELRSEGNLIVLDAVIAMMDLGLKSTEIVALLTEKASLLAWEAARRVRGPTGPVSPPATPPRAEP